MRGATARFGYDPGIPGIKSGVSPGYATTSSANLLELALQLEPLGFRTRELPGEIALALEHGDQALLVALGVGIGGGEQRFELALFRLESVQLGFDVGELPLQRLPQLGEPLARGGLGAFLRPAVGRGS